MKRSKQFSLVMCMTLFTHAGAQDINFSQFYELPMLRNPSLGGIYQCDIRAIAAYRNQWGSVTVPYRTMALETEFKWAVSSFNNNYLTLGAVITNDEAGDSKMGKLQVLPVLSMHLNTNDGDGYLSGGVMAGWARQKFDANALHFDDQFVNGSFSASNPTRQIFLNQNRTSYFDVSVGLSYRNSWNELIYYYVGGALFHAGKPKVAFIENNDVTLNQKMVLNAGLTAFMSEENRLTFYVDYFRQGGHRQAQGGVIYRHALVQYPTIEGDPEDIAISFGGLMRWGDALVPLVKLDYQKVSLGLTYDVNISKLKTASQWRGGFELTASMQGCLNLKRTIPCPVKF
jgi:type IX secretion system PorP/SprF family membrane protein